MEASIKALDILFNSIAVHSGIMLALVAALLIVAAFAAVVHRYAPAPADRWGVLLERYRPHAPMSDWSATEYEASRHYSDLAAAAARQLPDTSIPARTPRHDVPVSAPTPAQQMQSSPNLLA